MRILIHDFAGHPFQIQLSRELASRGHHVTHVYPIGLQGPKGRLSAAPSDPARLEIRGVDLNATFRKYSPLRRLSSQRQYARDLKRIISSQPYDVVLSGNTPIDVQAELLWFCRRKGVGFVHWVQDVYCQALKFFLRRKLGNLAGVLSYPFAVLERLVARSASANIVIAPGFADYLKHWGVSSEKISVLENWAPLDEIPPRPRLNAWSVKYGLTKTVNFIYSGTLGIKHRPDLLYKLASSLDNSYIVTVITEGAGRDYLERQPKLDNLRLLDFQPYDQVPDVLATADILLATLESDAGQFAVPSKVLSYLSAGRPLLLAAPMSNLAATVLERSGAGFAVDPEKPEEWVSAAKTLAAGANLRAALAANARRYAEREFDISRIAARFENVLLSACGAARSDAASSVIPLPVSRDNSALGGVAIASASEASSN